jgi:nicotinamide phosphoribosyltransferase
MKIELENDTYKLIDQATWEQEKQGELKEVFRDGVLLINQTFSEIRARVSK